MYVCAYVCMYVFVHESVYVGVCVCLRECLYVHVYVCMYVCIINCCCKSLYMIRACNHYCVTENRYTKAMYTYKYMYIYIMKIELTEILEVSTMGISIDGDCNITLENDGNDIIVELYHAQSSLSFCLTKKAVNELISSSATSSMMFII